MCLSVCGRTFKLVSLSLNTDVFIWLYYAWTVKPLKYTQDIQWLEGCKCFGIEMQAGQAWALYRKSKVLFPGGAQDGETVLYKVELKSWFLKYDFCTVTKCIKRKCNHFFLPDSFCCCFLFFPLCVCVHCQITTYGKILCLSNYSQVSKYLSVTDGRNPHFLNISEQFSNQIMSFVAAFHTVALL